MPLGHSCQIFVFDSVPDQYKIPVMSVRYVSDDFIPDWFVTSKMVEDFDVLLGNAVFR